MLILSRYLKAVILTTYLCSLSHLVENRHMSDSEDQHLEPRLDTRLSTPPTVIQLPTTASHHHKHRHKHNINNVNNSELMNNLKSDKDIHIDNNILNKPQKSSQNDFISTSRQFLLFNRCSHHYIYAFDRLIHARAQPNNEFSQMLLETHHGETPGITIRSANAGVYVCFNKRGKLVTRWDGRNVGCLFTEEATESRHIKYRSLYNSDWYLGFNRKGAPMVGKIRSQLAQHQHLKRERCYQFLKKSPQKSTPKPILDHEVLHKYDKNIAPINVRPKANARNSFRVTPKSVLRLMRTSSAPDSNQLIYSFSNNNNFNNYNIRENNSTNASINSHKFNIRPNHRLNGRAIDG